MSARHISAYDPRFAPGSRLIMPTEPLFDAFKPNRVIDPDGKVTEIRDALEATRPITIEQTAALGTLAAGEFNPDLTLNQTAFEGYSRLLETLKGRAGELVAVIVETPVAGGDEAMTPSLYIGQLEATPRLHTGYGDNTHTDALDNHRREELSVYKATSYAKNSSYQEHGIVSMHGPSIPLSVIRYRTEWDWRLKRDVNTSVGFTVVPGQAQWGVGLSKRNAYPAVLLTEENITQHLSERYDTARLVDMALDTTKGEPSEFKERVGQLFTDIPEVRQSLQDKRQAVESFAAYYSKIIVDTPDLADGQTTIADAVGSLESMLGSTASDFEALMNQYAGVKEHDETTVQKRVMGRSTHSLSRTLDAIQVLYRHLPIYDGHTGAIIPQRIELASIKDIRELKAHTEAVMGEFEHECARRLEAYNLLLGVPDVRS